MFANGPGDQGSIPGQIIPKTQKMELDTSWLITQYYKVHIKGKVKQSRERSSILPTPWCSCYWKGSLQVALVNLLLLIKYMNLYIIAENLPYGQYFKLVLAECLNGYKLRYNTECPGYDIQWWNSSMSIVPFISTQNLVAIVLGILKVL